MLCTVAGCRLRYLINVNHCYYNPHAEFILSCHSLFFEILLIHFHFFFFLVFFDSKYNIVTVIWNCLVFL